jgi:6-phosphogluconolactonase (cycloisomerase 2 family)
VAPTPAVPSFAFVVDTKDAIASYAIDPTTGVLRSNGYTVLPASTSELSVSSAAASPSLAPPMVINSAGFIHLIARSPTPTLVVATLDSPTGRLAPRTLTWPGAIPLDIVGHPSGKFLYVIDSNSRIQAATVDASNGNLTPVGMPATSFAATGLTHRVSIDPQGTFLIAAGRSGASPNPDQVGTIAIDQATGAPYGRWRLTDLPFQPGAVVVHPTGRCGLVLPLVPDTKIAEFSIAADGTPTGGLSRTVMDTFIDAAFDSGGTTVFALGSAGVTPFPITDTATCALGASSGAVAPLASPLASNATRLSIEPSGRFLYATDPSLNRIDAFAIGPPLTSIGSFPTRIGVAGFAPVFMSGTQTAAYPFLYVVNHGSNDISILAVAASGALTAVGTRISRGTGPFAIAIDPWNRFAYVANRDSGTVGTFTIDRLSGALTSTVPVTAVGTEPVALAVDASGRFLFVANFGSNNVRLFTINQSTGQLSAPPVSSFAVGSNPMSLAIDPTGTTLYVSNIGGQSALTGFTISQSDGLLAATGARPSIEISGYTGIGVDVRGRVVFAADTFMANSICRFRVNPVNLDIASASPACEATGLQPTSVAVDPLGRFLYTANYRDSSVWAFSVFPFFGVGTNFPTAPAPSRSPNAAIVDPSGRFLYVAYESGQVASFSINASTGALTAIGSVTAGTEPEALAIAR